MRHFIIVFIFLMGLTNHAFALKEKTCSRDEAIAAEDEASMLKDWSSVYKSFQRFARCDDAAIGEGYSGSIARLLTEDWKSIEKLNKLTSKDKQFERFVLHHVDELMSPEEAQTIYENVRSHCPVKVKKLCISIENKLDEMTSHIHICPSYGKAICVPD